MKAACDNACMRKYSTLKKYKLDLTEYIMNSCVYHFRATVYKYQTIFSEAVLVYVYSPGLQRYKWFYTAGNNAFVLIVYKLEFIQYM